MNWELLSSDLHQYRREVEQIPPLSEDEIRDLVPQLIAARVSGYLSPVVKERVILGCLHLVLTAAQHYPFVYRADLIQEGNIGLIQALKTFPSGNFMAYICAAIRHAMSAAMDAVLPIRIPRSSLQQARKQEKVDALYDMQPVSLDRPFSREHSDVCLADVLEVPIDNPYILDEKLQLLKQTLAKLPLRERQVLELRYGLDGDDQREHSYAQAAQKLGMTKNGVMQVEHRAIAMLTGKRETPEEWRARKRREMEARRAAQSQEAQRHCEQERQARLDASYKQLQTQHLHVSVLHLARAARVSDAIAQNYLRRVEGGRKERGAARTRAKLERAYRFLQEQNVQVTARSLSMMAHVTWEAAKQFLTDRVVATQTLVEQGA